ncbi:MAG: TIGR04282 family arsenosugar biosynthesis glycosyltransferase [Candidatus Omnitrophota bacterium]
MKDCLIVFAKEPQAGLVKTRLNGELSQGMCVRLYKAFLKDTLCLARSVKCFVRALAYESYRAQPDYLKSVARDFIFHEQKGKGLGEKMRNAFGFARRMDCDKIVIMGSDSPNLPAKRINDAFKLLDTNDIVLGPSLDGGYYLIGLKAPCAGIFRGVRWSSQTVFARTLKNALSMGKKVSALKSWYDVDEPFSLSLLRNDLRRDKSAAPWTRKLLKI